MSETYEVPLYKMMGLTEDECERIGAMDTEEKASFTHLMTLSTLVRLAFPNTTDQESASLDSLLDDIERERPEWNIKATWGAGCLDHTVQPLFEKLLDEIAQHIPSNIRQGSPLEQIFWQFARYKRTPTQVREENQRAQAIWSELPNFINEQIGEKPGVSLQIAPAADASTLSQSRDQWGAMSETERIAFVRSREADLWCWNEGLLSDSKELRAACLEAYKRSNEQVLLITARAVFPELGITETTPYLEMVSILNSHHPHLQITTETDQASVLRSLSLLLKERESQDGQQSFPRQRRKRQRLPEGLPQQTFMEARNAAIAFADARNLRRWQEVTGEVALCHIIPDEPIQIKLTANPALDWWGVPATYDGLRDELRSMELSAVLLLHNMIGSALKLHQVTTSIDEMIKVIGWTPRFADERARMRRTVWRWLLQFNSVTVLGMRPGQWKDRLTRENLDLTSRDALIKIIGDRPAKQHSFDNSEPPIEVTWVAGPWLNRFRGNDQVLQYFGDIGKIAAIPSKQPRGAWAQSVGLALNQLWRERQATARVIPVHGGERQTVQFERPFTRYELLDLFRAEPWVEDILTGDKPHRARTYWREAIKLLKCIIGQYKELDPPPQNRIGWQDYWLKVQRLDIRPREAGIKAIAELSRRAAARKRSKRVVK